LATRRDKNPPERPPATTLRGREDQLIAAAYDLAEKQIREGKASSQVTTHFLKLGSTREQVEQQRLQGEVALLQAKIESMASADNMEQRYQEAIAAMRRYQGLPEEVVE
jgi:hypothetical protein